MPTDNFSTLPFSQCISKISIKHKIKQKDYLASGKYPVIDQGQSFISGYCDDEIAIKIKKPIIVFGDHTRCFKFVDFNFVAGADGIHILEPKYFFNEKLFYYFCLALDFPNKGYSRHFQYLAKTIMKIPPLEIQKRIVARLESAFEKIEKGSAHLQDAKTKLAKYKQSLLKSAFDGTLTAAASLRESAADEAIHKVDCHDLTSSNLAMTDKENPKLPQGWTIKTLGELGEIVTGSTPNTKNREYYGDEYPFYKPTDLNLGYCVENSSDMVSSKGFEISRKLPSKSILVTCIGATIGKTGLIRNAGICNQQINAIIPKQNICPEFVYFYCISNAMQELIKTNASATTLPILNKTAFSKLPIPLPPLETQKQIVKLLEKHLQHADKTGEFIESALNKAKQLKQSLLKSAFLGKLV